MKLVVYLSGETRTKSWHQMHDSAGASLTIPRKLEAKFLGMIKELELLAQEEGQLEWMSPDALHDVASDWSDEGGDLGTLGKNILHLLSTEVLCDAVHFIQRGTA